jgi:hypothetical protein
MAWPAGGIATTNLDADSDSPQAARPQLLAAVQAVNDIAASRGVANGIPSTGADGLVPPAQGGMPTGALLDYIGTAAPTGWVLASGRTIGSAASGATERANADTSSLYTLLWTNLPDTIATVTGGRGASAAADFAANKPILLPDMRGRATAGLDNMGGTAAGRMQVSLAGTTTAGSAVITGISSTTTLAVGMAAFGATLPASVTIASIDSATQVTLNTGTGVTAGTGTALRFGFMDAQQLGSSGGSQTHTLTSGQLAAHNHPLNAGNSYSLMRTTGGTVGLTTGTGLADTVTNTSNNTGGQAHPNIPPTIMVGKIIKL